MENVIIRKAEKTDCNRILQLVNELATYVKSAHEVTVSLEHFTDSGFGKQPVWWAFVAEVDGVIEGFALYYIRFSTWKGQKLYLEDLLVTEQLRCKGIGTKFFEALISEAKARSLNGIVWQVVDWNEPAIQFYKKLAATFDKGWINCSIAIPD